VQNASPPPNGMVVQVNTKTRFRAEDCTEPKFYIDGILDGSTLTFEVVAVVNGRRGQFTGRHFFDALMNYFGIRRIKVISAVWSDAVQELKTNLDIFNAETRRGATKEKAAFATKTGLWAKDYRFTTIQSLDTTPDDLPGGYEQVLVAFVKTPKATRPRTNRRRKNG